jgi:thiopurine S-methyltransferase
MDSSFWLKKWESAETRFHKNETNPNLILAQSHLLPGAVLVPLCGKTLDMIWLEKKGHPVIGAELSPIACKAFFEENDRPYAITRSGEFTVYSGSGITIWCGDFFRLKAEALAGVTSVFDRAALVALPPPMRVRYAAHLTQLMKQAGATHLILVTFEYDQQKVEGPPHSVPEAEVRSLFAGSFRVRLLDRHEDPDLKSNPRFKDVTDVFESLYTLEL